MLIPQSVNEARMETVSIHNYYLIYDWCTEEGDRDSLDNSDTEEEDPYDAPGINSLFCAFTSNNNNYT